MTQLGMGVAALNHDSSFQAAYEKGMKKQEYWTHTLEDCIHLIARLPALASRIYRNVYKPDVQLAPIDKNLDLVGNRRQNFRVAVSHSFIKAITRTSWVTVITTA